MLYIIVMVDAITFGFFVGLTYNPWLGLLVGLLTAPVAGMTKKTYQLLSAAAWGYILYIWLAWLSPERPEYQVVVIISAVIGVRFIIAWFHWKYDENFKENSDPNLRSNNDPIEQNETIGTTDVEMEPQPPIHSPNLTVVRARNLEEAGRVVKINEWAKRKNKQSRG